MIKAIRSVLLASTLLLAAVHPAVAQGPGRLSAEAAAKRWEVEKELASLAVIERKVMMPMRDGVRLATDIYYPKDASRTYPTIFDKTPYNFNYWDVRNGVPADMTAALTAI